jgi:hypothetical protein
MNTYLFRVQLGDGKPVEAPIKAKDVVTAVTAGYRQYPAARNLHLISVIHPDPPEPVVYPDLIEESHPLFGDSVISVKNRSPDTKEKIKEAIALRWKGLNYRQIGKELNVPARRVSSWLNQYC